MCLNSKSVCEELVWIVFLGIFRFIVWSWLWLIHIFFFWNDGEHCRGLVKKNTVAHKIDKGRMSNAEAVIHLVISDDVL